jgi:hypothetical protein
MLMPVFSVLLCGSSFRTIQLSAVGQGEARESHLAAAHDSSARKLSFDDVQAPRDEIVPSMCVGVRRRRRALAERRASS